VLHRLSDLSIFNKHGFIPSLDQFGKKKKVLDEMGTVLTVKQSIYLYKELMIGQKIT
jgi:hypothetical protein